MQKYFECKCSGSHGGMKTKIEKLNYKEINTPSSTSNLIAHFNSSHKNHWKLPRNRHSRRSAFVVRYA